RPPRRHAPRGRERLGDGGPGATRFRRGVQVPDDGVAGEQVVVATNALVRADLVGDLDAALDVADSLEVAELNPSWANARQCVSLHLDQTKLGRHVECLETDVRRLFRSVAEHVVARY